MESGSFGNGVMKCVLVLEDGFSLEGRAFAGDGEVYGEVVFNTSMTGYQEIVTDPSYKGQIVTLTYPLIGNYGINGEDAESGRPQVEALIVREYSRVPHNWRSTGTLRDYLEEYGLLGMEGVDTRALTKHIREAGAMRAVISTRDLEVESLLKKVRSYPGLVGRDMVRYVTSDKEYVWNTSGNYRVIALDFGIKYSILRMLEHHGCQVTVVPAYTKAEEILAKGPDGILLSNGPGDPAGLCSIVSEVRKLLGRKPVFGICLGHQLLGLALGLRTFKLKFGHRGGNHPVKNLQTGKVEITSQNHGFCVELPGLGARSVELREEVVTLDTGSIPDLGVARVNLRVTHVNLNDFTLEGTEGPELGFFSVQYHPEASPGPHDSRYLFWKFVAMMERASGRYPQAEKGVVLCRDEQI